MGDYFKLLWWALCGKLEIVKPSFTKSESDPPGGLHDTAQPAIRKI
jgi:hypothetical protein